MQPAMEATDTQTIEQKQSREILSSVFAERGVPRTPTPAVDAATPEKPAEAKAAEPAKPADTPKADAPAPEKPKAEEVKTTETPKTEDPYASVLDKMPGTAPAKSAWTDEAKAAFKDMYGHEDPVEFKKELDVKLEQAGLLKSEYDKVAPIIERLNSLPPSMLRAYQLAMEGKVDEAHAFLRELPEGAFTDKEAKKIPDQQLVDTYLPGKISKEQWAMLSDPEADPEVVDALKTRIGILKDAATDMHEAKRSAIADQHKAAEVERKEHAERYHAGVAQSITNAKNSPLAGFMDNTIAEDIRTGAFLGKYATNDGTPTPEAATLHLWALHGPKLVEAAEARGFARGQQQGVQEAASRAPAGPSGSGRTAGDQPKNPTPDDQVRGILWTALQGRA